MLLKNLSYTIVLATCWLIPWSVTSFAVNDIVYSEPTKVKNITVNQVKFGVLRNDGNGKVTFIPTNKVILNEGNKYGWRIYLKDYKGAVTWREVLKLPRIPETWGTDNGEDFSISKDGKEAVTKRIQFAKQGVIENFWTVAPGDPTGQYIIEVYVDDRRVASFEFEVMSKNNSLRRSIFKK